MRLARQVTRDALRDGKTCTPLVEAEGRAGVHLEAHVALVRRAPQVDAGER
jgi:hypothetical protein